jgi:hypothetical protein
LAGFRDGLKKAGYVEGQNIAFEARWVGSNTIKLPAMATELVRRPVSRPRRQHRTIPIVFVSVPCAFKGTSGGTRRCDTVKVPVEDSRHAPRCRGSAVSDTSDAGLHVVAQRIGVDREIGGGRFGAKPVIGNDRWAGSFVLADVGRWIYSIAVLARHLPELVGFWLFESRGGGSG